MRNIDVHRKSIKAVDWMHFILFSGPVLLAGRMPSASYTIFVARSRAFRLLLRPRGLFEADITATDVEVKYFVADNYTKFYRGKSARLPLCLSTITTLIDDVPLLRACTLAWLFWLFPDGAKDQDAQLAHPILLGISCKCAGESNATLQS